ncbi:MAG: UDP-N-acetylmuramoyl-L-alanine--D-glutamate ligase, partial [Woeseiaceae bacterium]|nr:UDP-N-acetylmuramoyl-L-alanine--D-glutamate ligase [Woeseiaceae bacterium]
MNAAARTSNTDLVVGLGATGLSIARYLRRNDGKATFYDTREEPPGADDLEELWPDAKLLLGDDVKLPNGIKRLIASPGVPDSHPLIEKARRKKLEIVSDIELFAREAKAPFIAVTGSNGKSTVTT